MQSAEPVATRRPHRLRFRVETFELIMDKAGYLTDASKADFLGIHQSQYTRAKNGATRPTDIFISQVLKALPRETFERLFEVVEVPR